eukprot:5820898-Prymnesium_polylepis.1
MGQLLALALGKRSVRPSALHLLGARLPQRLEILLGRPLPERLDGKPEREELPLEVAVAGPLVPQLALQLRVLVKQLVDPLLEVLDGGIGTLGIAAHGQQAPPKPADRRLRPRRLRASRRPRERSTVGLGISRHAGAARRAAARLRPLLRNRVELLEDLESMHPRDVCGTSTAKKDAAARAGSP